MKLFIRADATTQIGTGHIMRCIALGQAWRDQGGEVTFLSRCDSEHLRQRIIAEGFDLISIDECHPHPSDLDQIFEILNRHVPCAQPYAEKLWLCLDGYHFTPDYQKAIRDVDIRLLVIDDMNHLPHYHADILLNQNIHAPDLHYNCAPDTTLLMGTSYVLLRREFLKYRGFKRQVPQKAKNILVTMGGSDPDNVTLKVIQAIKFLEDSSLKVKVVIGPTNPNIEAIRSFLHPKPCSFQVIFNPNMPDLITWADLAISAGGSTCWELAYMGLPNLVIVLAENQKHVAKYLAAAGISIDLGYFVAMNTKAILQPLTEMVSEAKRRVSMAECGQKLVDGKGCIRLLKEMQNGRISLRPARAEDCRLVWEWANDPIARSASFSSGLIPWERHSEWFNAQISDPNTILFIAENDKSIPLGQIRYHISAGEAVLSINLKPEVRGRGFGSRLIRLASKKVFENHPVDFIRAYVKPDNAASSRVFMKAGFDGNSFAVVKEQRARCFTLMKEQNN